MFIITAGTLLLHKVVICFYPESELGMPPVLWPEACWLMVFPCLLFKMLRGCSPSVRLRTRSAVPPFGKRDVVCLNWSWHGGIYANPAQAVSLLEDEFGVD